VGKGGQLKVAAFYALRHGAAPDEEWLLGFEAGNKMFYLHP
jgi:hypothetical protein